MTNLLPRRLLSWSVLACLALAIGGAGCGAALEVSYPPSGVPSLGGPEIPACPCARRGDDLLLYVRIKIGKRGKPVALSALAVDLFLDGDTDSLKPTIRRSKTTPISDEVVALLIGETPPLGHVLRLEIRSKGRLVSGGLRCVYSGVPK